MVEEVCCKGIYFVDVFILEVRPREGEFEIACSCGVVVGMVTVADDEELDVIEKA